MERLTLKDDEYWVKSDNQNEATQKLGTIEDVEQKLEMPIDKFARVFMEGIWTKRFGFVSRYKISVEYYDEGTFVPKTCRLKTYIDGEWWQYFELRDYGKTWCLASEHEIKEARIEDLPEEVRRATIK